MDRQDLPLFIIQPKLEHFFNQDEPKTIESILKDFRVKHSNGQSNDSLIEYENETNKSIHFSNYKNENKRIVIGPNAVCFDTKNDDLVVLDLYRLRRFQCRDERKKDTNKNYPQLKFNLNKPIDLLIGDNPPIKLKKLKNTEVLETSIYDKYLLIVYLNQIMYKLEQNINLNGSSTSNEIKNTYEDAMKNLYLPNEGNNIFPLKINEIQLEKVEGEGDDNSDKYEQKIYQTKAEFMDKLEKLYSKYNKSYVYPKSCEEIKNTSCQITYQNDIPPFILQKGRKGIHDLSYDSDPTTIYHPQSADMLIRPFNNDWNKFKKKGIFKPQVFDDNVDKIQVGTNGILMDENARLKINNGKIEGFANPKEGYLSLKMKTENEFVALFNLTRELDNVGVNMYYDRNINCVLVPDVMNNRIQVMECLRQDFFFKGQFGNLPYTSNRSLPNYRNTKENNIHFSGGLMYEPIVDTERYDKIKGYTCSNANKINLEEFKKRGPFNLENNEDKPQNVYCNINFNQDRFNIHSRNMIEKLQESKEFVGHFGKLYTEYCRVNGIDINTGKINDISNNLYFENPHFISVMTESNKDGVSEASLAYKKLLYKNIKITNEGQKFGQLFRPKAVAYDDDYPDKNGRKYYVVDTYHHCIQCFESLEEATTVDGAEIPFESADKNLNGENQPYLYDEKMREGNRFASYSNSTMYSLGIRQKIIDSNDNRNPNSILTHHPDWALANGQNVNDKPMVMLYRWLSGTSTHGNFAYGKNTINYKEIEDPFFYTGLGTEKHRLNPGCGEFLFPSDILITKNPYTLEKLLMVADTGNNRVSIFKKYKIPNAKNGFRFRFYRFLQDTYTSDNSYDNDKIYNPISLACCKNTGRIFVLNGNLGTQKILIFRPKYDNKKNELRYIFKKDVTDLSITDTDSERCIRISLDDRGFLACLILNETANSSKIVLLDVNDVNEFPFTLKPNDPEVRLNSIYFNLNLKEKYLEAELHDSLSNVGRFRFILNRLNESVEEKNDTKYKKNGLVISPEYKLDYKFNPEKQKLDTDRILKDYTMKDELRPAAKENYWAIKYGDLEEKIPVDLIDENKILDKIKVAEFTKYLDTEKIYNQVKVEGNQNLVLNNVENWVEQGMFPNTTYQYQLGFYNYNKILFLKEENNQDKIFKETTMPLGVPSKMVNRKFNVIDDKNKRASITIEFQYGNLSQMHYETQKFNPLYCYLFRKEHNRDRNISTKYITLKAKQWMQIIVPADSKYIFSKYSKPKFGKLYVFNSYGRNSPEGQGTKMEMGKYYREDYQMLYYSAEGGEYSEGGTNLPDPEELSDNSFVDDFFTLGDNPSSIHRQIKFRVRINLQAIKEGIDDKYIHFTSPDKIGEVLENYNKDRQINEHSMVLVKKEPLFDKDYNYKNKISILDKGSKLVPISYNKTYEYFVMIGNHKKINSGVNSFYVTTKPSKPLFNKKGLEKITLVENGQKKNYLKIEWFTPKNENIYWPFNFLLCRRVNKSETSVPPQLGESKPQKNPDFTNQGDLIRIKDVSKENNDEIKYYHQVFKHGPGDWKVSFVVYGLNNNNKDNYEKLIEEKVIKIKYFDHKENKIQEKNWQDLREDKKNTKWTPKSNFKRLSNVSNIELFIPLAKGFTLTKMSVVETVVITENGELSKYELAKKIRRQQELQQIENNLRRIENEKTKQKNRFLQKQKQLGQVFLLSDDYEDTQKNNYGGYGGELYRYLKEKPKEELLKIFDRLHSDILIYHGDITMKFEGPSGMLRSGNRDMLIDKIRYMSMILRSNHDEALQSVNLSCSSSSVAQMFSDTPEDLVNPQKQCLTKQENTLKEKKKVIEEKKLEIKKKEDLSKMRQEVLKNEVENLRAEMERANAKKKANILDQLKELEKKKEEEEEKIKNNEELIKKQRELSTLEKNTQEIEEELKEELPMPSTIDKILEKGTYLEEFRDVLKIERVIKNKMYIGNYGGFYGEKMRVDLKTFLIDLRTGITTNSTIRENFKTMSNIIYDFNKRELFFVLPGEKVIDNIGNLVDASNHVVIFFGEERKTREQLVKEKEGISKISDSKLKKLKAEIATKKKLLLKKGVQESELESDVDLIRLEALQNKIKKQKTVGISEWSFIKQGKPELFTSVYPEEKEIKNILEDYAITPTLASLSSRIVLGSHLFEKKDITTEEAKKEYISHHQLIELSKADTTPYQYCIGTFQTGFSFNSEEKKSFMGMDYLTEPDNTKSTPFLHHGGSYSDLVKMGKPITNELQNEGETSVQAPALPPAPDTTEPVIKFFSPKEGIQGSIVKIVGQKLDEIEYFCFRDVKAEILQKTKTFILEEKGEEKVKVVYDMILLKVPSLKQLGKECWQSLRPYEALVWGYYKMGGKQIRTSEIDDVTYDEDIYIEDKGKKIHSKLMFRYLDRTQCPEGQKLEIPK